MSRGFQAAVCTLALAGCALIGAGLVASASDAAHDDAASAALSASSQAESAAAPAAAPDQTPQATPAAAENAVMTLGGSRDTYVLVGETYLEAGCHAVDPASGALAETVTAAGQVDTSKPGTYQVEYTATMADGSQAKATRTVHVVESFEENAASIPVLMYHYVYRADAPPAQLDGNYILDENLAAQLQYLTQNEYYYPSFQEVKAFVEGTHTLPAKSVVLTFDDGEQGFLNVGIPLLERYEVPATSFIICSDDDAAQKIAAHASPYVSFQSHSYAMHQAGSNVGRGGRIHAMTQQEIYDDIVQAQSILGTTEAFAYPFGDNNPTAQAALREAGVLCAFTIANDRIYPGDDPTALNRVRISGDYSQAGFEYLVAPAGA